MEIKAKNISVKINGRKIFSNVNFEIGAGEMVAITGPSGCGKTTLLNCLGITQSIDAGSISIFGKDTTHWKDKDKIAFWHKYATFIYQDYGIIEDESVAYNVTLNKRTTKKDDVKEILQKVGLGNREKDLAIVLSGGEKQRLGIARAIYKKASIIYADEPTASLDADNKETVIHLLQQFALQGSIVILATHDEKLISQCNSTIDMSKFKN